MCLWIGDCHVPSALGFPAIPLRTTFLLLVFSFSMLIFFSYIAYFVYFTAEFGWELFVIGVATCLLCAVCKCFPPGHLICMQLLELLWFLNSAIVKLETNHSVLHCGSTTVKIILEQRSTIVACPMILTYLQMHCPVLRLMCRIVQQPKYQSELLMGKDIFSLSSVGL